MERSGDVQVDTVRVLKENAVGADLLSFLSRALGLCYLEMHHLHRLLYSLYRIFVDIVLYIVQCC